MMISLADALEQMTEQESRAVLDIIASWNGKLVAKAIEQAARPPVIRGEAISSDAPDDNAAVTVIP